nr:monofunctional biosynthetic peptidoglycan transglycosylase [Chelativorans sp.]
MESEGRPRRARTGKRFRPAGRLLRGLMRIAAVVVLLPLVLTLLYIPSFVHPVSTLMLGDLATLRGYERRWVPLEAMGDNVVHAVMMSEDGQFCSHPGIDFGELKAVIDEALSGERTRGASTIPMQTVKNLFLWPGRSFIRKALEAPLAVYLDIVMPKRRIMEIYLNIAEWGPGIYGAEAAARHYFGQSARDLSRRQAALLAVTLPNPYERNPARPSAGLRRIASVIEARARRAGGYVGCLG